MVASTHLQVLVKTTCNVRKLIVTYPANCSSRQHVSAHKDLRPLSKQKPKMGQSPHAKPSLVGLSTCPAHGSGTPYVITTERPRTVIECPPPPPTTVSTFIVIPGWAEATTALL